MRFINFYASLIGGALLLSCNGKKDYKLEEVLRVEQQQDLRWIKADSCECFVLNSFAENPLDSVYVSWTGTEANGLANGDGTLIVRTVKGDSIHYKGSIYDGRIKGNGTLFRPDKSTYVGELYYVEYGKGKRVYENGDTEDGFFLDGVLYTGTKEKVDSTEFLFRGVSFSESEYNRRIKQLDKYFVTPKIGELTRQYFDSSWVPCKKEDASYYRIVTMMDANYPEGGVVKDFYINGDKQNVFHVEHINLKHNLHIPIGENIRYNEDGSYSVQTNFNWKITAIDYYTPEGGLKTKRRLQPNYSDKYEFYNELGNPDGYVITSVDGRHRYEKEENGDTTYRVNDSLGYEKVLYWERIQANNLVQKGWYRLFQNDEYAYPISPVNYYSKTGKLFKTENWINLSDSSTTYNFLGESGEVSYLGNDQIDVNNSSTDAVRYLIDFDFPDRLDWNVTINFKINSRKDGLVLVYNWDDWDNHNAVAIFNESGGYVRKSQIFEGEFYDPKTFYSYKNTMDWKSVDFTKNGRDITLTGLTRNAISLDDDNFESIGFVFFPETDYTLGHIVQTIFYDTTASNVISGDLPPIRSTQPNARPWQSYGSGVVLTEDGYVVTNHHVVEDASDVEIGLVENNKIRYYSGEIISKDVNNDLALVRISDNSFKGFGRIPYNVEIDQASVGKEVFALGYPLKALLGDELKFTNGRISARSGAQGDISKYQMTVPLQPGNSGGPVFDFDGNLIGIAQGGIKYDVAENVAYCVKTTYVKSLVESLPDKFSLPNDRRNRGEDVEDIIKEVAPYVTLIRVR